MADDNAHKVRTQLLANELLIRCNAELAAAGAGFEEWKQGVCNVLTAMQIVTAHLLILTGVPPAEFMTLVTRAMMRGVQ